MVLTIPIKRRHALVNIHLYNRPSFYVTGKQTWISGQDNSQFGRFWDECRATGLLERFSRLRGAVPGAQTGGYALGVSRVDANPSLREFYYLIGVEVPIDAETGDLEVVIVPACTWAVFECRGPLPGAIVEAEMFAFIEWLPQSGYRHALAPEMEVYSSAADPGSPDHTCEFWLPVARVSG
jgi:AraC family transcriptional regulator